MQKSHPIAGGIKPTRIPSEDVMNLINVSMNAFAAASSLVNRNGFVVVAQRTMRPTGLMSRGQHPTLPLVKSEYPTLTRKPTWPSIDRRPGEVSCSTTASTRLIERSRTRG